MKLSEVTLEGVASGAAPELFAKVWGEILANIQDPNTEPTAARSATLKVTVTPAEDRESGELTVALSSKLAPPRPVSAKIYMGRRDGRLVAVPGNAEIRKWLTWS